KAPRVVTNLDMRFVSMGNGLFTTATLVPHAICWAIRQLVIGKGLSPKMFAQLMPHTYGL
ncbi:hypothetical protein GGI25_006308, partial [Coemansia spiralis]